MTMEAEPDWHPWRFGRWHPEQCFSHLFQSAPQQETDIRKKAIHGWHVTGGRNGGKFSVYHTHPHPQSRCNDDCQVYGHNIPELVEER